MSFRWSSCVSKFVGAAFLGLAVQVSNGQMPPPTVIVAPAFRMTEPGVREFPAVVESIKSVTCVARVAGVQEKTHFTEGSMVKAGDLLFEIEDTTYKAVLAALRAKKEQLEQSLKLAQREYERSQKLIAKEIVTESAHDTATCTYMSAKASIKEIEANIVDAENNLSYTKVYAPISGRIGKATYTDGNLVSLSSGSLVGIEQLSPIYVKFSLSERVFRKEFGGLKGIKDVAVVQIRLADGSVYHEKARITLIDNKVNPRTNTIALWATFKNAALDLIPGSYVTVMLSKVDLQKPVAVVPSALIYEGGTYGVMVVGEGNVVKRVQVVPGAMVNGGQIIMKGLKGDENVVIEGTNKAKDGMVVAPVQQQAEKE